MKFLNKLTSNILTWAGVINMDNTSTGNIVDFQVGGVTKASIDANGKYIGTLDWASVNGVPSTFDPVVHDHDTLYYTESEITTFLAEKSATTHVHGNISSVGAIGTTANLPVLTSTSGVLVAKAAGTSGQYLNGLGAWATPIDTNTTYAEITTAEIDAGAASTLKTMTGRRAQYIKDTTPRFQAGTTAPTNTLLLWVDTN